MVGFFFFCPDKPVENRRDENYRPDNRGYCHGLPLFLAAFRRRVEPAARRKKAEPTTLRLLPATLNPIINILVLKRHQNLFLGMKGRRDEGKDEG
ncbi:MAG: hypothetical protein ACE15E_14820 [Acidobacteriota bacterium]